MMGLPYWALARYLSDRNHPRSLTGIEEPTRHRPQATPHGRGLIAGGLLRAWSAARLAARFRPTFRAFRGGHSYEVQVGKIVVQARHRGGRPGDWSRATVIVHRPRRFNVWIDFYGRWFR